MNNIHGVLDRAIYKYPDIDVSKMRLIGWGAGPVFSAYYPIVNLPIEYTVCPHTHAERTRIHGVQVKNPQELLKEPDDQILIVIFSGYLREIESQIASLGPYRSISAFDHGVFTRMKKDLPDLQRMWRLINPHNETHVTSVNYPLTLARIDVGRRTYGAISVIDYGGANEGLSIGSFCSLAPNVRFLLGGEHAYDTFSTFPFGFDFRTHRSDDPPPSISKGHIVVKDDVWIGYDAVILAGVTIGQGAIVGAGSVVTKSIEPYCIVGGNPARPIKYRFEPDVVEKLSTVDFSLLTDQAIASLNEYFKISLNEDNVDEFLAKLLQADPGAR